MSDVTNVSRRGFLQGVFSASALVLSVKLAPSALWAAENVAQTGAEHAPFHPSLWVGIEPDGTVMIVAHRSEMGSGSRTALPLVLADELGADWKRVKIEQAIGDKRYGEQDTDGSHSVRDFYQTMREAGATARIMLVRAAAKEWGVPESDCEAELHCVVHKSSGKKADFGKLVATAAQVPVPSKQELTFKPKSAWRYIAKGVPSYDLGTICCGKAGFGADAHVKGMVFASVQHPPVLGSKVKSYDDKAPLQVKGVQQVVALDGFKGAPAFQPLGGVAVIADNTWSALEGKKKLNASWENSPHAVYNSDDFKKELQKTARTAGKVIRNQGDVDAEFAKGGKTLEADYYAPHLAHVSMEPPVALADVQGDRAVIWTSTQNPQAVQEVVAAQLGIPQENVICHVALLGGGFGRKSKPDYVAEAAILSKKTGKPVKVTWTREDDVKFGYYHSVAAMYMKAALGQDGMPTAWLHRSVFPPIGSTFTEGTQYGDEGEMAMGWSDVPYQLANFRAENGPATAHVRIGWLRSVANIYHAFAVQSFTDELAHAAGKDPVDYQLALLGNARKIDPKQTQGFPESPAGYEYDTERLRRVIELVAEQSNWGKRKLGKGHGLGIAAHRSFLTYVATVVEVEVNDQGGIQIPRVDTVVDAGLVVNPEQTRLQFEGAAVFGTSLARYGEITAKNGVIEQSNFNDYQIARMGDAPYQVNVHVLDSDAPPAGVGEPGVPPFTPALCNALFAATGKRVRELPLSKMDFSTA
ncbi:MAG TPA: molybdopterin cofactor-binding domain-containing protein [Terriglobales bacterium]|nr:molybdopterin cofactor-binding domain-containing protein [Terriglobales bacterium]